MKARLHKLGDNAAIGIGALIIFISIVLVAAIAASVLIDTSARLEMQALITASETKNDVSSGLTVEGISGYNESGQISFIAIEITPRAGSPPIDLSETVVEISDGAEKHVLRYATQLTAASSLNGDIFTFGSYGNATCFGINVMQDADDSCSIAIPVINYGDHVMIGVNSTAIFSGIGPRVDISGLVICEEGAPGIIGFRTPSTITDAVIDLQ